MRLFVLIMCAIPPSEVSQRQQAVTSNLPRKEVRHMSDFELLSVVLAMLMIIVTLLVNTNKK